MAQLTDDCFAFSGPLLPVDEVERIIRERVAPVAETEGVRLNVANGRVIARDVSAPIDLPPFDNSAVDGYAVRHADLAGKGETRLAVAERVTAGRAAAHALRPGEAVRIFTGAPMPAGADTVFMQEDVRADAEAVTVPPGLKLGANRRLKGEDVRAGSVVLPAGRRLAAQDVALAAAVGLTALEVFRRVRVAVFSTGDEIVEPGTPRPAPALFDANRYLLVGLIWASCRTIPNGSRVPSPARPRTTISWLPPVASPRAKPTTCGTLSSGSGGWCSGAWPSSRAGR
jgi:molybdopterin molybdotransferase